MINTIYSLNIQERREFIKSYLSKRDIFFKIQSFRSEGYEGENIIIYKWIRQDVPNIIISAHYDGWGAYDNVGGTAGLIWFIHWMELDGLKHLNKEFGFIIIFLDGEERGLLGAKYFIKNYVSNRNLKTKGQISLDGFGIGTHIGGFANTKWIEVKHDSGKEIRFTLEADTTIFQKYKIPSLHLFSLPYQELKALSDERKFPPSWLILHTEDDTPDKIEEEFLPFVILNLYRNIPSLDFQSDGVILLGDKYER